MSTLYQRTRNRGLSASVPAVAVLLSTILLLFTFFSLLPNQAKAASSGTWANGGTYRINSSATLLDGNVILGGSNGKLEIMNPFGDSITYGTWVHGTSVSIETVVALSNGNALLLGTSGNWEILDPKGASVLNGTGILGSTYSVMTSANLKDGNVILAGSNGKWSVVNNSGVSSASGTWIHGASLIYGVEELANGNFLLVGASGKWQIITPTGSNVVNGTWAHGTEAIQSISEFTDGNIFIAGPSGKWQIIKSDGTSVKSGILPNMGTIKDVITLSNGNVLLVSTSGNYAVFGNDGILLSKSAWIHTTSNGIQTLSILKNGDYFLAGDNGRWDSLHLSDVSPVLQPLAYEGTLSIPEDAIPSEFVLFQKIGTEGGVYYETVDGQRHYYRVFYDLAIGGAGGSGGSSLANKTGTWSWGATPIEKPFILDNGNLMLFGRSNSNVRWEIIKRDGTSVQTGTIDGHYNNGSDIDVVRLENGNLVVTTYSHVTDGKVKIDVITQTGSGIADINPQVYTGGTSGAGTLGAFKDGTSRFIVTTKTAYHIYNADGVLANSGTTSLNPSTSSITDSDGSVILSGYSGTLSVGLSKINSAGTLIFHKTNPAYSSNINYGTTEMIKTSEDILFTYHTAYSFMLSWDLNGDPLEYRINMSKSIYEIPPTSNPIKFTNLPNGNLFNINSSDGVWEVRTPKGALKTKGQVSTRTTYLGDVVALPNGDVFVTSSQGSWEIIPASSLATGTPFHGAGLSGGSGTSATTSIVLSGTLTYEDGNIPAQYTLYQATSNGGIYFEDVDGDRFYYRIVTDGVVGGSGSGGSGGGNSWDNYKPASKIGTTTAQNYGDAGATLVDITGSGYLSKAVILNAGELKVTVDGVVVGWFRSLNTTTPAGLSSSNLLSNGGGAAPPGIIVGTTGYGISITNYDGTPMGSYLSGYVKVFPENLFFKNSLKVEVIRTDTVSTVYYDIQYGQGLSGGGSGGSGGGNFWDNYEPVSIQNYAPATTNSWETVVDYQGGGYLTQALSSNSVSGTVEVRVTIDGKVVIWGRGSSSASGFTTYDSLRGRNITNTISFDGSEKTTYISNTYVFDLPLFFKESLKIEVNATNSGSNTAVMYAKYHGQGLSGSGSGSGSAIDSYLYFPNGQIPPQFTPEPGTVAGTSGLYSETVNGKKIIVRISLYTPPSTIGTLNIQ